MHATACTEGAEAMTTTAWRFVGTEGADEAVSTLKQLDTQELIDLEDVTVLRWPRYAVAPQMQEHVTDEGSKMASFVQKKLKGSMIDSSMIESVKGDMQPGTSALVVLSSDAAIDKVANAFKGQHIELIRSDLSVQQQDQIRAAFGEGPAGN
jgi:uncharacterized membrane protein